MGGADLAEVTTNHKVTRWGLGPAWIVAISIAFLVGVGVGEFAVFEIYGLSRPHSVLLFVLLIGVVVSVTEWLIIRSHIRMSCLWIVTGLVGWCLAALLMEVISKETFWLDFRTSMEWDRLRYFTFTVASLAGGFTAGTLQWLLLRGRYAHSFWWVAASTINWTTFGALSSGFMPSILPALFGEVGLFTVWNVVGLFVGGLHWLILRKHLAQSGQPEQAIFALWVLCLSLFWGLFVTLVTPGIITGTTLLWLIQQPQTARAESLL